MYRIQSEFARASFLNCPFYDVLPHARVQYLFLRSHPHLIVLVLIDLTFSPSLLMDDDVSLFYFCRQENDDDFTFKGASFNTSILGNNCI